MQPSVPAWSQPPAPSPAPTPPPKKSSSKPTSPAMSTNTVQEQPKKPRHRHSAFQLAALNELYEKNEHPSLEERTSLAERLGMETKTVNSWFQNKRASSKKRHKGTSTALNSGPSTGASSSSNASKNGSSVELPPISALIASVSAPPGIGSLSQSPHEYDDYSDEEYLSRGLQHPQQQSLFYAGNPQHKHLFEAENHLPRKGRSRPTAAQTEELRKLYEMSPHPSREEREDLGGRIGMKYQSVTNWFQNQRSIAKKRREEEDAHAAAIASSASHSGASSRARTFSPFPPAASAAHPSLSVPPATLHPSLALLQQHSAASVPAPRARRSSSAAPASRSHNHNHFTHSASRPSSPRVTPYRTPSDRSHGSRDHVRPRRTRPEPHQLEALKKLFRRTPTPSIEERSALARETGMDVGKVTNWFRNLRQTARKRARARGVRGEDGEEDELEEGELEDGDADHDEDMDVDADADDVSLATYNMHSRSVSRAGTPMHSVMSASTAPSPLMHGTHPLPYGFDDGDVYMTDLPVYAAMPSANANRNAMRLHPHARSYGAPPSRPGVHSVVHSSSGHSHSDPDPDVDSHMGSEEDYQEAVTPSPESSPPPPVSVSELGKDSILEKTVVRKAVVGRDAVSVGMGVMGRKTAPMETGVKVEDALLLLSFHHHVVR